MMKSVALKDVFVDVERKSIFEMKKKSDCKGGGEIDVIFE